MTTEQEKAFQEWWLCSPILTLRRDAIEAGFVAGWEAHALNFANNCARERAATVFATQEAERAAYKSKFLAKASAAFLAGKDDDARGYRDIANTYFS